MHCWAGVSPHSYINSRRLGARPPDHQPLLPLLVAPSVVTVLSLEAWCMCCFLCRVFQEPCLPLASAGLSWWFRQVCLQCRSPEFNPWVRKIPWRREWIPTPVFLPGECHGHRSLAGYSSWDGKDSDMAERLTLPLSAGLTAPLLVSWDVLGQRPELGVLLALSLCCVSDFPA